MLLAPRVAKLYVFGSLDCLQMWLTKLISFGLRFYGTLTRKKIKFLFCNLFADW